MKKATYKFIPPQGPNDNRLTILLGGELTINTINEFVDKLQEVLSSNDNFLLKITGVEAIDLAFLQVIHSFVHTAKEQGKKVSVTSSLSPEIILLLKNSGVYNILSSENN
jgi:anti-anti-sigma regulatory factor